MTQKKKITIPAVRKAYQETGITPMSEAFFFIDEVRNNDICGCPITALYLQAHPQVLASAKKGKVKFRGKHIDSLASEWANKTFGRQYSSGFVCGVDGYCDVDEETDESFKGYYEGSSVKKSLNLKPIS